MPRGPRLGRGAGRRPRLRTLLPMAGRETVGGAAADYADRLGELLERHRVPGATLGILRDGEISAVGAGVLEHGTQGVDVYRRTPSSRSARSRRSGPRASSCSSSTRAPSSSTQPAVELLPGSGSPDAQVTRTVTMRHLLTHTSGIDGDVFTDTGRGDDCLERYVTGPRRGGAEPPARGDVVVLQLRLRPCGPDRRAPDRVDLGRGAPGTAGRAARGSPATVTLPEDALLHRDGGGACSAEPEGRPRARLDVDAAALRRARGAHFLRARRGRARLRPHAPAGRRRRQRGARALGRERRRDDGRGEVRLPDTRTLGDSWGLGWIRYGWDAERLLGHDGNTLGQAAFLRVLPSRGIAVALLANSSHALDLSPRPVRRGLHRARRGRAAGAARSSNRPHRRRPGRVRRLLRARRPRDRGLRGGRRPRPALHRHGAARRAPARRCTSTRSRPSSRASTRCGPPGPRHRSPSRSTHSMTARYVHYGARANPLLGD